MFQPKYLDEQAFQPNPRLRKVKEYVHRHYRESLDLQVVAELTGLERTYFSKYFHNKTGVSFHDCLSRARVSHAVELMAYGDRPLVEQSLTEIALGAGFHDLKTFERAVEKCAGHTPRGVKNSVRSPVST